MSAKDKFHDDSDLDQLAHDLDLDMDAPIGATFAAALREQGGEVDLSHEEDIDLGLDDDGFLASHDLGYDEEETTEFDSSEATHEQDAADLSHEATTHEDPHAEQPAMPPPVSSFADHTDEHEAEDDSPPFHSEDVVASDSEAAGQGLGYDYSFGSSHSGGDRADSAHHDPRLLHAHPAARADADDHQGSPHEERDHGGVRRRRAGRDRSLRQRDDAQPAGPRRLRRTRASCWRIWMRWPSIAMKMSASS